ncbi:hypothetical protein AB0L81_16915, partial [Streptomyces sp. NPDC052127]
ELGRVGVEVDHVPGLLRGRRTRVHRHPDIGLALGEGRPVREALAWASAAAALSVQRPGASASMPYRSEIETQYAS